MKIYIPPQLPRLIIAFIIFISLFLVIRHLLIPDTFGEYGHYRGESLLDNANLEIRYSGQEACFECHKDIEDLKYLDLHSDIHCETCHGPGQKHVDSKGLDSILIPNGREFCGTCHSVNAARKRNVVFQVELKEHNVDKNCIECHNPHQPWELNE